MLASRAEMVGKIRAAVHARVDPDLVIIARVESLIAGRGVASALRRAQAYAEAGADAVVVHAKSWDLLQQFLGVWDNRCPLIAIPTLYNHVPLAELARHGYRVAIFPNQAVRAAVQAMRLIEREGITFFTGVPLMSHEIATHPDRPSYDLSSCTYFATGGAAQAEEHVRRIRNSLPHGFPLQGYGLTETNCIGCTNFTTNYLAKPDSTGPANRPLVEVAILGSEGEALPPGMAGEKTEPFTIYAFTKDGKAPTVYATL